MQLHQTEKAFVLCNKSCAKNLSTVSLSLILENFIKLCKADCCQTAEEFKLVNLDQVNNDI